MGNALISRRGGNAKAKEPTNWTFLQAISANGTFNAQANTWYRVYVYGKSGNGGTFTGGGSGVIAGRGGCGGGGAGGYAESKLYFKAATSVPVTVNTALSSFGSYLSATAGTNGGSVPGSEPIYGGFGAGGAAGTGTGGNVVNQTGGAGGDGGANVSGGVPFDGAAGGNTGGTGGLKGNYTSGGGGGGGGGRLRGNKYIGVMGSAAGFGGNGTSKNGYGNPGGSVPNWNETSPPTLYGGGGGAGSGSVTVDGVSPGGTGSAGLIIIERGV